MKVQTEGFIVVGDLPNDERYRCLICGYVPGRVWQDLYIPETGEIPATLSLPISKTLVMPYRLCPTCSKDEPKPWKIRLLMLARLNEIGKRSNL